MPTLWTIRARRQLRQSLAEMLSQQTRDLPHEPNHKEMDVQERLNDILAGTFPGASVVIQNQVLGYRRKKDNFILLIETFGGGSPDRMDSKTPSEGGTYVVKIGLEERITKEIDGWKACRPPGLTHDLVLLGLEKGETYEDQEGRWLCIVYGDAQQFLGVEVTVSLEQAAREAIRSGFPDLGSIGTVITELYERIGHLLYGQAFVDDPDHPKSGDETPVRFALNVPKLDEAMQRWESSTSGSDRSCCGARDEVNKLAKSGVERFIDPVDYLRYVQTFVPWKDTHESPDPSLSETLAEAGFLIPKPAQLVPRMLRGCAHGDLHGRNVLVAIVRNSAMWPVLFDYEDMSRNNLIGWDFVKLETELKIRAYLDLFQGETSDNFIKSVQRIETKLNERTEKSYRERSWPEGTVRIQPADHPLTAKDEGENRLLTVLLKVRRMASIHLGDAHGRPNEWLEELYFLLTCYGVWTGRFENLQPREWIAAFLSAGVAAARLSWPRAADEQFAQ